MKSHLPLFAIVLSFILGGHAAQAQSTPEPAAQPSPASNAFALTPDEKQRVAKLREQALAANPDLKTEHDVLTQEGQTYKGGKGTPEQRAAFMQKILEHQKKMDAAMLKIDPSAGPLLDKLDAELKRLAARVK